MRSKGVSDLLTAVLLWSIRAYRASLGVYLGGHCRFVPSCSEYGLVAVSRHGALRGLKLIAARLLKCHPLHPGGWDPVPEAGTGGDGCMSDTSLRARAG